MNYCEKMFNLRAIMITSALACLSIMFMKLSPNIHTCGLGATCVEKTTPVKHHIINYTLSDCYIYEYRYHLRSCVAFTPYDCYVDMSPTSATRCIPIGLNASKVRTMTTLRNILGLVILFLLLVCIYKTRK